MTDSPVPFDRTQARLLPIADLVMVLMISRPPSGSLRDTRVTIVTIYLAVGVAVVGLGLGVLGAFLAVAGSLPWAIAAVLLVALAAGCADLAAYGIRQRLIIRP